MSTGIEDVLTCFYGLSGRTDMDRTDKAEPLSEHQCSLLAQPQANGEVRHCGLDPQSPQ